MSIIMDGSDPLVFKGIFKNGIRELTWPKTMMLKMAHIDSDVFELVDNKIQAESEWAPMPGRIVHCGTHNRDVEILKEPERVPYVSAACRALDNNDLFWGGQFSTIKTPEQIEAEDRGRAILKMQEVTAKAHLWNDQDKLAALYDAGLRFVEVTK